MSKYNTIPTNTPLIDSLSLRIELSKCKVLDKKLTSETCTYYESLNELDDELNPPKPIIYKKDGISLRIRLQSIPIKKPGIEPQLTEFIQLTIPAKLLKQNYFNGITLDNIYNIWRSFLELKVFSCSYQTFINSKVSDIDICMNRFVDSPETFNGMNRTLLEMSGTKQTYFNIFNQDLNLGLEINNRFKATPSLPYIKTYFKQYELQTKSLDFRQKFLPNHDIENLTRVEITIGNYKHKKRLFTKNILPKFDTLYELLNMPQSDLLNFMQYSIGAYITTKPRTKVEGLSPSQHLQFHYIQTLVHSGHDLKSILSLGVNTYKTKNKDTQKNQRSRMKKETTFLFDLLIHTNQKLAKKSEQNANINSYLKSLGIKI